MEQTRLGGLQGVPKGDVSQWHAGFVVAGSSSRVARGPIPNGFIGVGDKEERWHGCHRRDALR